MTDKAQPPASTELVTESPDLTLEDLCKACNISNEEILTFITEGIIQPRQPGGGQWYFSHTSIIQLRRAKRLESDLGLNPAGIALAFDLMAEIETLRRRLGRYEPDRNNR